MTLILEDREVIYIVLIDVFAARIIFVEDAFLPVFVVCVEKTRQINCFVLYCCT